MTTESPPPTDRVPIGGTALVPVDDERLSRLRRLNLWAGVLHLATGLAMLALANDFSLPLTTLDYGGPPGTPVAEGEIREVASVPLAPLTASFALLSALFHFIVASPLGFGRYGDELRRGRNRFRWVEYSLSATLMIVLIMLVTNITDVAALVGVAAANVAMILFGWIMEMVNEPGRRVWWSPFVFGSIAGAAPWIALVTYIVINVNDSGEGPPGFVYGIIVTIFVLFNCFAVNQWLQYRGNGRWSDYVFGEQAYIVLSFVAKSLLAWQIYANILID